MTISTPYALSFLALQMRRPDMRLTLNLRDDKPPVNCHAILHYIQARREYEKTAEGWWEFAEKVMGDYCDA